MWLSRARTALACTLLIREDSGGMHYYPRQVASVHDKEKINLGIGANSTWGWRGEGSAYEYLCMYAIGHSVGKHRDSFERATECIIDERGKVYPAPRLKIAHYLPCELAGVGP